MPLTILMIDDSSDDRYISGRKLRKKFKDIEILEAVDGVQAIELLDAAERMPDLIFLDINMPRMDGHEFLDQRYHNEGREVPVVVMLTSSDQTGDIERTKAYSCVRNYFIKPLDNQHIEILQEIIETIRDTATIQVASPDGRGSPGLI